MKTEYVLIDTNCWIDLIAKEPSEHLELLEYWVNEQLVTLLIPVILKTEWLKVKSKYLQSIKKEAENESGNSGFLTQLHNWKYKSIQAKANRVDKLMDRGNVFEPTDRARAEVTKHFEQGKAPFHRRNNNSNADALLYLSTIDYLENRGITKLVFISRDADDFTDPDNPRELHPNLERPGIDVQYLRAINFGLHILKEELRGIPTHSERNTDYVPQYLLIDDCEESSLVDQLYRSINAYREEIAFIPPHILARVFPFRIRKGTHSYSYYSNFRINSNNKDLTKLFKSIQIDSKNNITLSDRDTLLNADDFEKLASVLRKLNRNLIFDISSIDRVDQASIRLHESQLCNCVRCLYERLDFYQALTSLTSEPSEDLQCTLKQAYIHFQFGYVETALHLYHYIYNESKSKNKPILSFLCLYNLKKIVSHIDGFFMKSTAASAAIIEKIRSISIREYYLDFAGEHPFVQDTIKYIAENTFYTRAFEKITDTVDSIRDQYHSQLQGGWVSSNSYIRLISAFAEIDEFLGRNCIIYNHYSEFESIVDKLVEGLFTIYAFNDKQIPHISALDSYLVLKIVAYAKPDTVQKFFNRLQFSELKLARSNLPDIPFEEFAVQFFSDFRKIKTIYDEPTTINSYFFWERYRKVFANILTILTVAKDTPDLSPVMVALLSTLKDEAFLRKFDDKFISDFVRSKGQHVSTVLMQEFLSLAIENDRLHEPSIFSAIKHQALSFHPGLIISDENVFKTIEENFLYKCKKCNLQHTVDIIIHIYAFLDPSLQKRVTEWATQYLHNEFTHKSFYLLAFYEVVDYKPFFGQFIASCSPPTDEQRTFAYHFTDAYWECLNHILNLAFKFDLATNTEHFEKFKGISSYYDWLLDLEDFDYALFKPEWILQHQSSPYLKKILSTKQVRDYLREYLMSNKHDVLCQLYVQYPDA